MDRRAKRVENFFRAFISFRREFAAGNPDDRYRKMSQHRYKKMDRRQPFQADRYKKMDRHHPFSAHFYLGQSTVLCNLFVCSQKSNNSAKVCIFMNIHTVP